MNTAWPDLTPGSWRLWLGPPLVERIELQISHDPPRSQRVPLPGSVLSMSCRSKMMSLGNVAIIHERIACFGAFSTGTL